MSRRWWVVGLVFLPVLAWGISTLRMEDVRYWFPWEIQLGPLHFHQLEEDRDIRDGTDTYCDDCLCNADGSCADAGATVPKGARVFRIRGRWQCFCAGSVTVACHLDGDACTNNVDCCAAACVDEVCITPTTTTLSACDAMANIAGCPFFCDTINECPCATTTTSTTAASTTTTTVTTTTTTTGTGSTTTVTTTTSTTSTTINFASTGFVFAQNLPMPTVDEFEADGQANTSAVGTGVIMPAHGTVERLAVITGSTPFNVYGANHGGAACGGGGPACPVWTICLQQSDTPFDDSAYSDTALCCTINPILNQCNDLVVGDDVDVKDGALLTFRVTADHDPPPQVGASVEIHP